MRTVPIGFAIALAATALGGGAQAQNYPWCAQYSGKFGGIISCSFVSFDQCMATVRGMGGFCIVNNTYAPPPGPAHPAHAAKKHGRHPSST